MPTRLRQKRFLQTAAAVSARRFLLTLSFALLSSASLLADDQAAEKAARDALAPLDKGGLGWKVRMEAWVRLMKAGPAAVPVLEEALKKQSPGLRAFATQALAVMRGPAAIPKAATDYDLSELDSAGLGQIAPDFSLADVSGKAHRLSQFRGKKAVVLTFLPDDG
jgi:hypothetical protein